MIRLISDVAAVVIGLAYFVSKFALALPDAPKSGDLLLASTYATLLLPDGQSEGWGFGNYPFVRRHGLFRSRSG